ncbi:related to SMT3 ubiquitin-like protein [Sporisorium scitamineum]|uniref:Related to SMT3 ubiquitin-like protein n=1 Tax=Sporisorium scitamineum TaxID=49012 RepID=A0A127Z7J7_9BASI|nr:related to SMT3 ubiquitin-like protein [Sporisorium scitamineum]
MVEGVMAVQNPVVQHDGGQGDDDATMTDGMLHGQKRRRKEVVVERREREQHPSAQPASQDANNAATKDDTCVIPSPTPASATVEPRVTSDNTSGGDTSDVNDKTMQDSGRDSPVATAASAGPTPSPTPPLPAVHPGANRSIEFSIRDANNNALRFIGKSDSKFCKLFQKFAERNQTDIQRIRFIGSHGVQLPKDDLLATLRSVGVEDGDVIDVMIEQIGG